MIKNIELFNWKCFGHLEVPFSPGINFVTGPNGIGKSSILQAICLAFTGQGPSGLDLKNLVRKGSDSTRISLTFEKDAELFRIERNFSIRRREKCVILNSRAEEVFAGNWGEVTDYVEKLLKIRTLLFNKLFLMSEGDVYRTLQEPPGKQLLNEVDRLLGITQLQSLADEVKLAKQEFQQEFKDKTEIMEKAKNRMQIEDRDILEKKLSGLQKTRETKREEQSRLTTELWKLRNDRSRLNSLLEDFLLLNREEMDFIIEKDKAISLRNQAEETRIESEATLREELETEADVSNFRKIIDVISGKKLNGEAIVTCPVCRRPISAHEMNEIESETRNYIQLQEQKLVELKRKKSELEIKGKELESELKNLNEREVKIRIIKEKCIRSQISLEETRNKIAEIDNKIGELELRINNNALSLGKNESDIGDLRETLGRLNSADLYESGIGDALFMASRGLYLSEFTSEGIEALISQQRDSKLREKLYNSISEVWNSFKGERGWTFSLDQSALPSVQLESQFYPFNLLSAGEKTALLVVTRTMLSTLFSKDIDFMLLDEPLEHLDSRNKRSLLQFLVDALKEKLIEQLIVTTTEHSLLRKFIDYENIKIIPLDVMDQIEPNKTVF